MTAAMLVLEPIFEADLPPEQYAYRPGRNAQQDSSRRAFRQRPTSCPPATCGCMRSSTMASASLTKDGDRVRLYSRPGNGMTRRFPLIAEALTRLRSRSCIIDGEAVACDDNGLASFERIRYRKHDGDVFLYAFDLIELNGDDLRRDPLEVRKATLASIVAKAHPGIRFNEHIEGDGPTVFAHGLQARP
jgi:hypothetical protein